MWCAMLSSIYVQYLKFLSCASAQKAGEGRGGGEVNENKYKFVLLVCDAHGAVFITSLLCVQHGKLIDTFNQVIIVKHVLLSAINSL